MDGRTKYYPAFKRKISMPVVTPNKFLSLDFRPRIFLSNFWILDGCIIIETIS
jgi:hypothetical protein